MSRTYKIKTTKNRESLHNEVLQNENLSWKAKGLFSHIITLPNEWELNIQELCRIGKDGRESVQTIVKELMDSGYIERVQISK